MPTIGEIIAQQESHNMQPFQGYIIQMTGATTTAADVQFVNATGRTPTSSQTGVFIRAGGVLYLVGLF
jgi:hypothetical protein